FDEYFRKITLCRMSGLMVGVLLAYAKEEMPALWSRMLSNRIILTGPLVLLIYLSFIHDGTSAWFLRSTSGRILFFPIYDLCCALLLPLMASIGGAQGMAAKTIEWLSKVSYSAYLSHLPVLQLLRFLIGERHLPWLLPISIATTLAVSSALYRFWESPWLSRRTVSSIPAR
ncbi:MAG: acyltransferase family protein, partial [Bdellovibrionota bacterium]